MLQADRLFYFDPGEFCELLFDQGNTVKGVYIKYVDKDTIDACADHIPVNLDIVLECNGETTVVSNVWVELCKLIKLGKGVALFESSIGVCQSTLLINWIYLGKYPQANALLLQYFVCLEALKSNRDVFDEYCKVFDRNIVNLTDAGFEAFLDYMQANYDINASIKAAMERGYPKLIKQKNKHVITPKKKGALDLFRSL